MLYKSALLLVPFLATCFACSCMLTTQKEAFDRAGIVAHVTITAILPISNISDFHLEYTMHYNESFKPSPPKNPLIMMPIPLPNTLTTADNSAACGVNINYGEEYLIAGEWDENKVFVSLCSGIPTDNKPGSSPGALPWSSVSKKMLKGLRNGFK